MSEDLLARARSAVRTQDKALRARNEAIRAAVAGPHTIADVVKATGMSRAQVERIVNGATRV